MLVILAALAAILGVPASAGEGAPPNILLLIADDLGVDRVGAYGEHPDPGRTPVIDQLAAEGVMFRSAWSNPFCSASRAGMLTGRYSFRTGIGTFLPLDGDQELSVDEVSIPDALPPAYRSAAVGKWHLSGSQASGPQHPMLMGFEYHRGSMSNLTGIEDYYNWEKNVDGTLVPSTTYATTDTVDEALALIDSFSPDPWFLWVAFNAPHRPYHHPPAELHTYDLPAGADEDGPMFMKAMTESMDTEIGRLLASMDPDTLANTVIIFVGDNGTSAEATTAPFSVAQAKGTVYEGGVNVPLIVKGPGVAAGAEIAAVVNTTDLFATITELAGSSATADDSVSMVPYLQDPLTFPMRIWTFTERFTPDHAEVALTRRLAIRERRYKIRRKMALDAVTAEQLFDLEVDPFEELDLLSAGPLSPTAQQAYDRMTAALPDFPSPGPWHDLGSSLPGTFGPPELTGSGTLVAGDPTQIVLTNALPHDVVYVLVGYTMLLQPEWGGQVVPYPDLVLPLVTDGAGQVQLVGSWPPGIPPMFWFFLQAWQQDPLSPLGFAASNGLLINPP